MTNPGIVTEFDPHEPLYEGWEGVSGPVSLVDWMHRAADIHGGDDVAYFAAYNDEVVKIGFTCNPKRRLAQLRTLHHEPIKFLAMRPGGELREAAYHAQFWRHRVALEWFTRCPEIEAEIERLSSLSLQAAA